VLRLGGKVRVMVCQLTMIAAAACCPMPQSKPSLSCTLPMHARMQPLPMQILTGAVQVLLTYSLSRTSPHGLYMHPGMVLDQILLSVLAPALVTYVLAWQQQRQQPHGGGQEPQQQQAEQQLTHATPARAPIVARIVPSVHFYHTPAAHHASPEPPLNRSSDNSSVDEPSTAGGNITPPIGEPRPPVPSTPFSDAGSTTTKSTRSLFAATAGGASGSSSRDSSGASAVGRSTFSSGESAAAGSMAPLPPLIEAPASSSATAASSYPTTSGSINAAVSATTNASTSGATASRSSSSSSADSKLVVARVMMDNSVAAGVTQLRGPVAAPPAAADHHCPHSAAAHVSDSAASTGSQAPQQQQQVAAVVEPTPAPPPPQEREPQPTPTPVQGPPVAIDLAGVLSAIRHGSSSAGGPAPGAFLYNSPVKHLTVSVKVPLDDSPQPRLPATAPPIGLPRHPRMSAVVRSALLRELHLPPSAHRSVLISPITSLPGCTQMVMVVTLPIDAAAPTAEALLRRVLEGPLGEQLRGMGGATAGCNEHRLQVTAQVGGDVAAAAANEASEQLAWETVPHQPLASLQQGYWLESPALLLPAASAERPVAAQVAVVRGLDRAWLGGGDGRPRVVVVQGDQVLVDSSEFNVEAAAEGQQGCAVRWVAWGGGERGGGGGLVG